MVILFKDDLESSKKQVEDAKENGREEAKIQAHWLKRQQKERSIDGLDDRLHYREVMLFDRCSPSFISRLFPHGDSFPSQQDRMVRFRNDDDDQRKLGRRPDKKNIERPTPGYCVGQRSVCHPHKNIREDPTYHDVK